MVQDPVIATARGVAESYLLGGVPAPRRPPSVQRRYAIGDPQTSADKFWAVLAQHGLLAADGWLRPDVGLVSMGDHFDYGSVTLPLDRAGLAERGREGLCLLAWLAAHPREQVTILFGNHDLARVQELSPFHAGGFERAQARAEAVRMLPPGDERQELERAFIADFPTLASSEVAVRDLSTFQPEQADLVRAMLLEGRADVAAVHEMACQPVLLTHNGITRRELALLSLPQHADAHTIGQRLAHFLRDAVERVRVSWEAGRAEPLDLAPVHHASHAGLESGGLFAHRPADPAGRSDASVVFDEARPRRFHPERLPLGLAQACGHTRPRSSARELSRWATEDVHHAELGPLRTLRVCGEQVRYALGLLPHTADAATLYMIDPHLHDALPERVQLLELW